jgi:hypothetical protein
MKIPSPIPRELILVVDPKAGLRVRSGRISGVEELVEPLRNLLAWAQAVIRPLYGVSEEWLKENFSYENFDGPRPSTRSIDILQGDSFG